MFRTLPGAADPVKCSEDIHDKVEQSAVDSKSSASTKSDLDAVERASFQDTIEDGNEDGIENDEGEKPPSRPPSALNARPTLSRVVSRITTHSIRDPGPAPDGGFKAWLQVAMGWLAIATTWGWINCFGET